MSTIPMPETRPADAGPRRGGWWATVLLGLGLSTVYLANGRDSGSYDTTPACLLTLTLVRGEGAHLERFAPMLLSRTGHDTPPYVTIAKGHIVSRYPVAPALMLTPIIAVQVAMMDRNLPGWDRLGVNDVFNECKLMAKRAMAVFMAMTMMLFHRLLIALGLRRVALPAALACALGSDIWMIGSQAPWQHGPAAFCLVSAIYLLLPEPPVSRLRLVLGGMATAMLVACRLMDMVFALTIFLHVARRQPRGLAWFLPGPMAVATLLLCYNLYYFGHPIGGQAQLEQIHRSSHNLPGPWSGDLVAGALGTLFSPNRGLFVFSPWILLALLCLPATARRLAPHRLLVWLLGAIVPFTFVLSKYAVWWGGHCFGPRYWTDVIPLFAILLAYASDWAVDHARALRVVFAPAILLSIGLQATGALCYPSTWCLKPTNIDLDHARLWDWRDTEITRCIREYPGYHPRW